MGSLTVANKVPVVDFTTSDLKPGTSLWLSTTKVVCKALEEYGCFEAIFDKVSPELDKAMFDAADELFDLPTEIKSKNVNDKPYHGYVPPNPVIPLHEGLGIDYVTVKEEVEKFTNLMWPDGNDHFCQSAYSYSKTVEELDRMVVRMIFEHYGIEKYYGSHMESITYLLKFLKYRVPQEDESEKAIPRHTDKTFLSILHQNGVNGLEIRTKNGEWMGFDLTPSSFVVMAGEAGTGWSNGRIHPCDHRVTMNRKGTRYTLGLFSFIKGIVQVPEELVDDEHPLKYKPFDNIGLVYFYDTVEGRKHEYTIKAYCGVEAS